MKIKNLSDWIVIVLLIFLLMTIIIFEVTRYQVTNYEVYYIAKINNIEDNSFERFNQKVVDCCTTPENAKEAIIFSSKSTDSYDGGYSLNLTSSNHCACTSFPVIGLDNPAKYLLTFYYKGDNPKFCNWVSGDNKCMPVKYVDSSREWAEHKEVLEFTEQSLASAIYFYADSRDKKMYTNL